LFTANDVPEQCTENQNPWRHGCEIRSGHRGPIRTPVRCDRPLAFSGKLRLAVGLYGLLSRHGRSSLINSRTGSEFARPDSREWAGATGRNSRERRPLMGKNRDEIVAVMKAKIDETSAMLDEFEKKAAEASGEAEVAYKEQLAKLREQSDAAKAKLQELADSGDEVWQNFLEDAEKLRDAFVHSFNYFKSQL
jgi:nucleotide-binding universal stress UspA family protein